eukprot:SAG31_NODE_7859_length_1581_cov_1.811066_2_plen_130_part_00
MDQEQIEEDQVLTMRDFTRCLLLAAHVAFCGAQRLDATAIALQRPSGDDGGHTAISMHTALWALMADMERSPYCTQRGIRFANIGRRQLQPTVEASQLGGGRRQRSPRFIALRRELKQQLAAEGQTSHR